MKHPNAKRVLIVEDDPGALEVLKSWVEAQGYEARTARSGQIALQLITTFEPDVLLTDYLLQDELTGVDLITQLRSRGVKMRCVLLTGVLQNALLESVHRLDRVPILTKPFDFGRLRELIATS